LKVAGSRRGKEKEKKEKARERERGRSKDGIDDGEEVFPT